MPSRSRARRSDPPHSLPRAPAFRRRPFSCPDPERWPWIVVPHYAVRWVPPIPFPPLFWEFVKVTPVRFLRCGRSWLARKCSRSASLSAVLKTSSAGLVSDRVGEWQCSVRGQRDPMGSLRGVGSVAPRFGVRTGDRGCPVDAAVLNDQYGSVPGTFLSFLLGKGIAGWRSAWAGRRGWGTTPARQFPPPVPATSQARLNHNRLTRRFRESSGLHGWPQRGSPRPVSPGCAPRASPPSASLNSGSGRSPRWSFPR